MKYCIFTKPVHVEKLVNFLNQTNIDYCITTERYETDAYRFDIGVSYCWPHIVDVKYDFVDGNFVPPDPRPVWYNYHPAPLPEYPGVRCYSKPIYDRVSSFGVTLHLLTKKLDAGPIISYKKFPLSSVPVHTNELGNISHYYLFQLFKETVEYLQFRPKNPLELEMSKREYGGRK